MTVFVNSLSLIAAKSLLKTGGDARNLDCDVTSWLRHALRARQGVDGRVFPQLRVG